MNISLVATFTAALAIGGVTAIAPGAGASATQFLTVAGGQIAYDDSGGSGPAIICVPGLGDVRGQYRFLAPLLVKAGFRVVTMDLRGMGESSVDWPDYTPGATGDDIVAMVKHLGVARAWIVGNSFAGASAIWAAAVAPQQIAGIVLIDPFVRDTPMGIGPRMALALGMHRPWGPTFWIMYYKSLYKTQPPADLEAYAAALKANLKEPGRFETLQAMVDAPKAPCEAHIKDVRVPALIIMGAADPDFGDPKAEADLVTSRLHGSEFMVAGAGHYPHAEMPQAVAGEVVSFIRSSGNGN
ncbi:MAG TPA: alpha/beta hydrolase [Candidatus Binataceae bacterium]|nr:alpha/beta hydrolase [Candidatus Binataceae bacterium]